jgi:hypothetical protein
MWRRLSVMTFAAALLAAASAASGQDKPPAKKDAPAGAPPESPPLIRLAPQSTIKQVGGLHYRLVPGPLDRTPGNAAPLWRLASEAFRRSPRKVTPKEEVWRSTETPLKDLPRKEVRDFLVFHAGALRLAREAACRERCDWEMPPLTIQTIHEFVPLEMLQQCRELAVLLGIQYRLQLAEGRFEDAAETLQTGFALARDLCEADMMLQPLVGIAIGAIMFSHVEEWLQTPGSPNLYWALTVLPRPFLDVRRSFEHELNTLHRSFPRLRRLNREALTERQADDLLQEVFGCLSRGVADAPGPLRWLRDFNAGRMTKELYPAARQHLLDLGRPAGEVEALPKSQVVLMHYVNEHDRVRDEVIEAVALPPWQAVPRMEKLTKPFRGGKPGNPILVLLMPAIDKTYHARVRSARDLARLRAAEALRSYAAAHEGKPPAKWEDIADVPLPVDPVTGKGFEDFYHVEDGRGVLEVPPFPVNAPTLGRRYELVPRQPAP